MKEFLAISKALSDENRVRALMALEGGELCVCQIIELLTLAPSTVSKHMVILHQAGLVETRKEGRWVHYRLADGDVPLCVRKALDWVRTSLADDPRSQADLAHLRQVREMDKQELCCHYRSRTKPHERMPSCPTGS